MTEESETRTTIVSSRHDRSPSATLILSARLALSRTLKIDCSPSHIPPQVTFEYYLCKTCKKQWAQKPPSASLRKMLSAASYTPDTKCSEGLVTLLVMLFGLVTWTGTPLESSNLVGMLRLLPASGREPPARFCKRLQKNHLT